MAKLLAGGNPQCAQSGEVEFTVLRHRGQQPQPPGPSKHKEVRYLDLHENEEIDEARLTRWVKQASRLPGWDGSSK